MQCKWCRFILESRGPSGITIVDALANHSTVRLKEVPFLPLSIFREGSNKVCFPSSSIGLPWSQCRSLGTLPYLVVLTHAEKSNINTRDTSQASFLLTPIAKNVDAASHSWVHCVSNSVTTSRSDRPKFSLSISILTPFSGGCLAWRSRVFFPPRKFKDNGATATAHEYLTYHLGPR